MFLSVYGHVNLDIILNLPRFPEPNTSIEIIDSRRYFGGTAGNVARIAAALGTPLYLVSYVGEDFPEDYLAALLNEGVDVGYLKRVNGYHTPTCWIMSDKAHNQIAVMDQGPMKDMENFEPDRAPIENSEVIHIATGRPGFYMKVVETARKLGKRIAFDPGQELHYVYRPESFLDMLRYADIFFCNEGEGRKALEYSKKSELTDLLNEVGTIVQTLGKRGSRILTKEEEIFIPGVEVENPVDTTGAGDAYRGGFYAALYRGLTLEACGAAGAITAAEVIKVPGGQTNIPSWGFVEENLKARGYR
ncbi:MAG: carbohydrate kinase family protein [Thermoplasmata archaeon]|nr:carbohydrate kinase family protein [Thermoplasmata archaeon]